MFDIVGKSKYFYAISILVFAAGLIGLLVNGINLDIQFQGGTIMQIEMPDNEYDATEIENTISDVIGKGVTAQKQTTFNPESQDDSINLLTLKVSKESTLNDAERSKVIELLRQNYGVKPESQMSVQSVEPFLGAELMRKGVQAALLASFLIVLYVWWRFRIMSLSAAVVAVVALVHDVLVMFAAYTVFRLPFNESFIAAALTILGYSLNDTVVIYDRIRENMGLNRKLPLEELVNKSIIQSLTRSINTMLSTLICILAVYIFATANNIESLKEFSFPLLIGVISGGYSTIFIAGPLWVMWKNFKKKSKGKRTRAAKA